MKLLKAIQIVIFTLLILFILEIVCVQYDMDIHPMFGASEMIIYGCMNSPECEIILQQFSFFPAVYYVYFYICFIVYLSEIWFSFVTYLFTVPFLLKAVVMGDEEDDKPLTQAEKDQVILLSREYNELVLRQKEEKKEEKEEKKKEEEEKEEKKEEKKS